jgi:hypothetical protein
MLADAHPFRVVAIGAEGRGAAGADPFRAALVPAFLFLEPLLQGFHQLVEAAQRLDQLLFLLGQVSFGQPAEPFLGDVGDVEGIRAAQRLDALEDMSEDLVETVDMALVLHQRRAREVVESLDVIIDQTGLKPFQQRQIFPERNGNPRGLQFEEEGDEHQSLIADRIR